MISEVIVFIGLFLLAALESGCPMLYTVPHLQFPLNVRCWTSAIKMYLLVENFGFFEILCRLAYDPVWCTLHSVCCKKWSCQWVAWSPLFYIYMRRHQGVGLATGNRESVSECKHSFGGRCVHQSQNVSSLWESSKIRMSRLSPNEAITFAFLASGNDGLFLLWNCLSPLKYHWMTAFNERVYELVDFQHPSVLRKMKPLWWVQGTSQSPASRSTCLFYFT